MTALLALIVVFFPIGILLRKAFPNLCALCFAVSAAWLIGLLSPIMDGFVTPSLFNSTSLGILMGGSAVGGMYYIFSKLAEEKQLFKLPYVITAFALISTVLTGEVIGEVVAGIVALWLVFFLLYAGRNNARFKGSIKRVIECCKNW